MGQEPVGLALGLVLCAGGLFFILGAIMNWDSFYRQRKSEPIVQIFGRQGARRFFGIAGLVLCVVGLLLIRFGVPR